VVVEELGKTVKLKKIFFVYDNFSLDIIF